MQRTPVSSTNLSSIGYDAQNAILEVAFHNGGIYQYYGVPASTHAALMAASSHGSYLAQYIKNRFRYRQVG